MAARPTPVPTPGQKKTTQTKTTSSSSTKPIGPGLGYNNDYAQFNNQGKFTGIASPLGANTRIPTNNIGGSSGGSSGGNITGGGDQGSFDPYAEQNRQLDEQVSSLYNSGFGILDEQKRQIEAGYPEEESNLVSSIENDRNKYLTEEKNLLSDTDSEEEKYNNTIRTALNQAISAFNALNQQRKARFGLGSSAGQAVGELAQQEYFKQQGNIQQKQAEGNLEFAKERGKIKQYVSTKLTDLDQYKKEALLSLKQNFQDRLNEIASRRGELEANRARDRISLLQETVNNARMIAQQDKEFRRQLGLAAVSKMQEISGRAFTPKEIKAVLAEFGAALPGVSNVGTSQGGIPSRNPNAAVEDEFGTLNPYVNSQ